MILLIIIIVFSIRYNWWRPVRKGFVSLMYHHAGTVPRSHSESDFYITPETFARHADMLHEHGYTTILLDEIENLPRKPAAITFDDGFLDNYELIFPILKSKNIKANIFLIAEKIGVDKDYLTWEHVREMQDSGLVGFGSHGLTHARLRSLSDEDVLRELTESKRILEEKLGHPVTSFAYPLGAVDARVRELVFKAGYLYDYSTVKGINNMPLDMKTPIMRTFPRGYETDYDFHLQITRGRSKL